MIILEVSPKDEIFQFEWRVNGEVVQDEDGENSKMFSLPFDLSEDDPGEDAPDEDEPIEVRVSSDCGASDTATIFIVREMPPTISTEQCPTTSTGSTSTGKYIHKIHTLLEMSRM